jgi:hypothetical protein
LLACIIIILYQREEAGVKRAAHGLALLRHASRRTRHSGGVACYCLMLAGTSLGQQRTQKPSSLARSLAASYFSSHCWDNPLVARAKREREREEEETETEKRKIMHAQFALHVYNMCPGSEFDAAKFEAMDNNGE